jgi:hypothetical protein
MTDLTDDKWVRVMADFHAEGVWNKDGAGCSADELPISNALNVRLLNWQGQYDEECEDYLPDDERSERGRKFDRAAFSEEGRQIAQAIKAELPDWTLIYFDDEKAFGRETDGDRSAFEYEIAPR